MSGGVVNGRGGSATDVPWADANQRHLLASLAEITEHLDRHAAGQPPGLASSAARSETEAAAAALGEPAAIDQLADLFTLSAFERATLLLLAGVELDARFAARCAAAVEGLPGHPCFGLALAALPDAHWSALSPSGPLRYWKMIEVGPGDALTTARLRIDERILHHLTGLDLLDERLHGLVDHVAADGALPPSHHDVVAQILHVRRYAGNGAARTVVHLSGPDGRAMVRIAATAAAHAGLVLCRIHDDDVPAGAAERDLLARLWERETALSGRALLIVHGDGDARGRAAQLAETLRTPAVLAGRDPLDLRDATAVCIPVSRPTSAEQRALWRDLLPATQLPDHGLDAVVRQFDLPADRIRSAALDYAARAVGHSTTDAPPGDGARADAAPQRGSTIGAPPQGGPGAPSPLWDAARTHARPRGDSLAQRIDAKATWADLVLPDRQIAMLHQIAAQVRHRRTVYDDWGFAARQSRGLGISALFSGRSGTGKTLAAEVLAAELALDLYRIDLSSVVSKYIGETEKNLRRVFDDAESGGSILLFDEADALFGKRGEVRDSHDRYANIEVSYLLQRMETYRGLAILTTNLKDNLDPAFMRRIRFVIEFRHPDRDLRERIWAGAFPAATPVSGVSPEQLSQLSIAGGSIRNIALNAAFIAADDGAPVGMVHLARAARDEFGKLERTLSEEVVRPWS